MGGDQWYRYQRDGIGDGLGILVAEQGLDCGCIFEELGRGLAMDLEMVFDGHWLWLTPGMRG